MQKRYQKFLSLLTVFCCICFTGCSTKQTSVSPESEPAATETSPSASVLDHTQSVSPDGKDPAECAYGIKITEETQSPSYTAKKDASVTVLKADASYPVFGIEGNTEAAAQINAAIQTELDTFLNFEKENAANAEEAYLASLDSSDSAFQTYTADFSYQLKRCDDKVISVVFCQSDFSGGAHGNTWSYGVTFHTKTGERLYLESLCSDYTPFHELLINNLNTQAASPAYHDYISTELNSDIDNALLNDSTCWYLDRSGLTFISNPYVLGSYAAGTFEFNIPYAELDGLKSEYAYQGPYIRKLFPGSIVRHDLNGDSSAEDLCYSIQTDADFSSPKPALTINGRDFSEELEQLHLSYLWTGAYYLMDIDSEDPYTEIAISNENTERPKETCTHFFRYHTDGKLVYLGNTAGIFNEDMQVRYNSNGNLILCDRNGNPLG